MDKQIAVKLFHKISFKEDGSDCWIPEVSTRSLRYEGVVYSLSYLSYILSDETEPYRKRQEIVRICGNNDCFNPNHLLFNEIDRFWSYVDKTPDGCWMWEHSIDGGGYGIFVSYKYGREKSHRISYMESKGEIPSGLMVLHECDNPGCCNPDHLFLGNNQDNMADKVYKNRQSKLLGSRNGRSILKQEEVEQMRKDYESGNFSYRNLVNKYGISQTQVARILKKESWSWVSV